MFIKEQVKALEISGIRQFNEKANQIDGVIKLTLGELDFNTPDLIKTQTKDAVDHNKTKYTTNKGLFDLRKEITKGTIYQPEECILTVGTTEGLAITIKSVVDEDDEVIVFTPGYVGYKPLIDMESGKTVTFDTLKNDITYEHLKAFITSQTKAILITNPNNPTGKILNRDEMEAIKKLVLKHDLLLIVDEIYSKIVFDDFKSFRDDPDLKKQMVVLDGFSKSHQMTGYRIGYLLSDLTLVNHLVKTHQYTVTSTSTIAQEALKHQVNYLDQNVIDVLKERRDLVIQTLDNLDIKYIKPDGAFYVFYHIGHTGLDSLTYATQLLEDMKVAVIPGVSFLGNHDDYVRLSYAVSKELLMEALIRIKTFEKAIKKPE